MQTTSCSDPSNSSSSSSSDSSDAGKRGKKGDKKKKKKKKKGGEDSNDSDSDDQGFSLGDLRLKGKRGQDDPDAPKRPQINKPPMFDGNRSSKPSYRQWCKVLHHYLEYHRDTWRRDKDMIFKVGSYMKDTARDWFDARDEQMRELRICDNYRSFVEAMDLRFKHDKEDQNAARKLRQVTYSGDVMKFLDTLQQLNMKVNMSGVMWQELIKEALPEAILDRLSGHMGGEPQEDDAFVLAVKEHGLAHERRDAEKKQRGSVTQSGTPSGPKGNKRKRGGAGGNAAPATADSSAPAEKKQRTGGTTVRPAGGKGNPPRFSKEQLDEALKGVQATLRDARFKKKLCQRCGLSNHRWQWCQKEINVSSTTKDKKKAKKAIKAAPMTSTAVATVSAIKMKAPENTVGPGVSSAPMHERILANLKFKADSTKRRRVVTSTSSDRIQSLESDGDDEDMD